MKADVKAKWLERLRSGEIEQATSRLRDGDSRCCLGVLCDVHAAETGTQWDGAKYIDQEGQLPLCVMEWAGLGEDLGQTVEIPNPTPSGGYGFKDLADLKEKIKEKVRIYQQNNTQKKRENKKASLCISEVCVLFYKIFEAFFCRNFLPFSERIPCM